MKKFFHRLLTTVLLAAIPTIFCTVLSTPISYMIPLKCPQGSQILGITCIDSAYHNTTPWYRRDIGPSLATLPIWLVLSLAMAWSLTRQPPDPDEILDQAPTAETSTLGRSWLPDRCPNCSEALSGSSVEWMNASEAKCPYCGYLIQKPETSKQERQ
jgi:DNA-directed RNA polymerase subunit RPC12/RpoP